MCENTSIDYLVIASISKSRTPGLAQELVEQKYYFTRIDASGGFLQGSTNTLLIGISKNRLDQLKEILRKYCRRRVSHIPTTTQIEALGQYSQPLIIEAETGGATIHTLPVTHFEQF